MARSISSADTRPNRLPIRSTESVRIWLILSQEGFFNFGLCSAHSSMDHRVGQRPSEAVEAPANDERPSGIRACLDPKLHGGGMVFILSPVDVPLDVLGGIFQEGFKFCVVHRESPDR